MEEIFKNHDLRKQNVEIPMKNTKNIIKSNKCNQCQYASSHKGHLRAHMKTHSGEKLNTCNQCDFASSYASALKTHLISHSGERPNKCNQCDYASRNLRDHLKTHSREKSNKCNQCDYTCARASNLKRH